MTESRVSGTGSGWERVLPDQVKEGMAAFVRGKLRPDLDRRSEAFFIQGQGADSVGGSLGQAPAEEPFGFGRAHIDAAVAERHAKIIVPVGAVEGVALRGEK